MNYMQLLALPEQERNVLVTEKVMGWRWYTRDTISDCDKLFCLLPPNGRTFGIVGPLIPASRRPLANDLVVNNWLPDYTANPEDDYGVLQQVKKTWDEVKQERFADAMFAIYLYRRDPTANPRNYGSDRMECLDYQLGDYAMAALLALEATP